MDFSIWYQAPQPRVLSVTPSAVDMSGGALITVLIQYLKAASSASQIFLSIGPRAVRNITVIFSDSQATSFAAVVTASDAPGILTARVSHEQDSRPAEFSIQYTGRQNIRCLQNCAASASVGSAKPLLARLENLPQVTRYSQLVCSAADSESCSLQFINSTSSFTFVNIVIGRATSTEFVAGVLVSSVSISGFQASASFGFSFYPSPTSGTLLARKQLPLLTRSTRHQPSASSPVPAA